MSTTSARITSQGVAYVEWLNSDDRELSRSAAFAAGWRAGRHEEHVTNGRWVEGCCAEPKGNGDEADK